MGHGQGPREENRNPKPGEGVSGEMGAGATYDALDASNLYQSLECREVDAFSHMRLNIKNVLFVTSHEKSIPLLFSRLYKFVGGHSCMFARGRTAG